MKYIVQLYDDSLHVVSSNEKPNRYDYKNVYEAQYNPNYDEGSTFDIVDNEPVQNQDRKDIYDYNKSLEDN